MRGRALELGVSDYNPGLEQIRAIQYLATSKAWDEKKDHWLDVYAERVTVGDAVIMLTEQVITEIENHQPAIAALLPTVILCILDSKEANQHVTKYKEFLQTQTHVKPITEEIYPVHARLLKELIKIE